MQPVGVTRNNKKSDIVVELGPEHAAAGARVVIEAKQNASYTVQSARSELEETRKNREAGVGVFVFSRRTAPEGAEPLVRYGDDILAIWDAENPETDIMDCALSVAKALSTRARQYSATQSADFEAIESAVREIERQSNSLDRSPHQPRPSRGAAPDPGPGAYRARRTGQAGDSAG